jgi:agmatinase
MKFSFATESFEKSNLVIFGFYKEKNEEKILNILRKFSYELEPIDIKNKRNYFEKLKIYDFGNLKINYFDKIFETLSKINKYSFNIFIPHLFSLFSIGICKENDGIIVFDAHADLKDVYKNEKYNRATWIRRLLEIIDEDKVLLIGIRSLDEDELYFLEENNINYITSFEIHENIKKCLRKIKKFEKNFESIYISFDIDVIDSCYVKTFYPEAYGLNLFEMYEILDNISNKIRAIDFCEFYLEEKDLEYGKNILSILFKLISLFRNNFP